jgi:DNA polymerase I-like protein with 3'-5' exonuclease and polymerase domains
LTDYRNPLEFLRGQDAAVYTMERNGIHIDADYCVAGARAAELDIQAAWVSLANVFGDITTERCFGMPPDLQSVSCESPKEIAKLLHGEVGLKPSPYWSKGKVKRDKGEIKLDAVAIGWLMKENPKYKATLGTILDLRRARGCYKYLRKLHGFVCSTTGRIHPCFGASGAGDDRSGAVTGRLACKLPELQQIPRNKKKDKYGIRGAFTAPPGCALVACDFTALEVVILAHITQRLFQDDNLARAVAPGAPDIHGVNALLVYRDFLGLPGLTGVIPDQMKEHPVGAPLRDQIKAVWYGLQYGKGAYGFGNTLLDEQGAVIGEKAAGGLVEGILRARPGIRQYQEWVREYILEHKGIPSLLGRWCSLEDLIPGEEWQENRAWRKALNFPMQAGGADICGIAMARVADDLVLARMGYRLILQVHDEIILEGPEDLAGEAMARLTYLMTHGMPLDVPLQAPGHSGQNWLQLK